MRRAAPDVTGVPPEPTRHRRAAESPRRRLSSPPYPTSGCPHDRCHLLAATAPAAATMTRLTVHRRPRSLVKACALATVTEMRRGRSAWDPPAAGCDRVLRRSARPATSPQASCRSPREAAPGSWGYRLELQKQ